MGCVEHINGENKTQEAIPWINQEKYGQQRFTCVYSIKYGG